MENVIRKTRKQKNKCDICKEFIDKSDCGQGWVKIACLMPKEKTLKNGDIVYVDVRTSLLLCECCGLEIMSKTFDMKTKRCE